MYLVTLSGTTEEFLTDSLSEIHSILGSYPQNYHREVNVVEVIEATDGKLEELSEVMTLVVEDNQTFKN